MTLELFTEDGASTRLQEGDRIVVDMRRSIIYIERGGKRLRKRDGSDESDFQPAEFKHVRETVDLIAGHCRLKAQLTLVDNEEIEQDFDDQNPAVYTFLLMEPYTCH